MAILSAICLALAAAGETGMQLEAVTASAEQSAAAAEELASQAKRLRGTVARFKLDGCGAAGTGGRSASPSPRLVAAPSVV